MRRSTKVATARLAAAAVLTVAAFPLLSAGSASAAGDADAEVTYASQVAVGAAVKLANPAHLREAVAAATDSPVAATATPATTEPVDVSTVTATPSGAIVIETESHQADHPEEQQAEAESADTSVAVLGTKIGASGSDTLAQTGPGSITPQLLVALALIAVGVAVRFAPALARSDRRH